MRPWHPCSTFDQNLEQSPRERAGAMPDEFVANGRQLLTAITAQIPREAWTFAPLVCARLGAGFSQAARALAQRHSAAWEEIVLANICYDLLVGRLGGGCSTLALPTPDGPVLARNMDWAPEDWLARASALLCCQRGGHPQFTHAGWSASLGVVSGLSAKGFGLVINAVGSPEGTNPNGFPVLLFLRRVVEEAANFASAVQMLTTQTLAASGMITLVGSRNEERVVVERTPTRHALRWGEPGKPLWTTNHYRTLLPDPAASDCPRYLRLQELLKNFSAARAYPTDELLTTLTDPAVLQTITAQHVIMRPARQEMELFVPGHLLA